VATSRLDLPDSERALLYAQSGNECAFPGCRTVLVEPRAGAGAAVNIGKAAHIIASSRQGPRGDSLLSQIELDKSAANRILLCPDHHDRIDQEPLVYTVMVLLQMKADHEAMHLRSGAVADPTAERRTDRLLSSLLPVVGLPVVVESASLRDPALTERDIATALQYPRGSRGIVFPFIARDGRLWTFSHLRRRQHPFGSVIDTDVEVIDLTDLASTDDEGHRRVIALLNRALGPSGSIANTNVIGVLLSAMGRETPLSASTAIRPRPAGLATGHSSTTPDVGAGRQEMNGSMRLPVYVSSGLPTPGSSPYDPSSTSRSMVPNHSRPIASGGK